MALKYIREGKLQIVDVGFGKQLVDNPNIENIVTSEFVTGKYVQIRVTLMKRIIMSNE